MRIVTAHPSPLLRTVLTGAFRAAPDIAVTASVPTLAELRAACRARHPQVVVAAAAFPDGDLATAVVEILRTGGRLLILSEETAADPTAAALFAGASGCLSLESCAPAELVAATRDVAAGHAVLHPAAAATVLRLWRDQRTGAVGAPAPVLSPRELEVLRAMGAGWTTKQIGRELVVSPKTVESHIARVLAKLGARNRAHAVSVGRRHGLLDGADTDPGTGTDPVTDTGTGADGRAGRR